MVYVKTIVTASYYNILYYVSTPYYVTNIPTK